MAKNSDDQNHQGSLKTDHCGTGQYARAGSGWQEVMKGAGGREFGKKEQGGQEGEGGKHQGLKPADAEEAGKFLNNDVS